MEFEGRILTEQALILSHRQAGRQAGRWQAEMYHIDKKRSFIFCK
jgi:hypothetical protein